MQFALELGGVLPRGSTASSNALAWPLWFVADDHALLALMGDPQGAAIVEAPGPRPAKEGLVLKRELSVRALPAERARVGLAIFCTEGGAASADNLERYARLQRAARLVALHHAASGAGLGALLAAWGLDGGVEAVEKLDRRLGAGADTSVLEELAATPAMAFMDLGSAVQVLHGGLMTPSKPVDSARLDASPLAVDPGRLRAGPALGVLRDGLTATSTRILTPTSPRLPEGTVLGSLVQTWQPHQLKPGQAVVLDRPLASPASLRASLVLSGIVRREG